MIEPAIDQRETQTIDLNRLRAALRLCFAGARADSLAALASEGRGEGVDDLATLVRAARARYGRAQWQRRLRLGHSDQPPGVPLAPRPGLSTTGALALALHLGLELDGAALAMCFATSPERIGAELHAARLCVQDAPPACRAYVALLGRYRDPSLAMHDRIALLQHTQGCERCRATLEAARSLDEHLLGRVEWSQANLPALERHARRRLSRLDHPLLLPVAGALLLSLLLIAGVLAANRFSQAERQAVPLLVTEPTAPLSGWILQTARGNDIQALDLTTGRSRTLFAGIGNAFNQRLLSPNGQLLAIMATIPGFAGNSLEVRSLDGTLIRRWEWGETTLFSYLTGWRGDSMLLLVQGPGYEQGSTQEEALARQERESRLLGLDIATGEERVLFTGSVSYALASPDGTLVAISKVWDPRWPGFSVEIRPFDGDRLGEPIARVDHRYTDGGDPIWAPDSSRLYLALIADDPIPTRSLDDAMQVGQGFAIDRVNLASLGRDGTITHLTHAAPGEHVRLLGVSPDGARIVYAQGAPNRSGQERNSWSYWLINSSGGNGRLLAGADTRFLWQSRAFWSPDGQTLLLTDQRPFYLSNPDALEAQPLGDVPMIALLTFDSSGNPLAAARARLTSGSVLAWLPTDALAPNRQPAGIDADYLSQTSARPVEWQDTPLFIEPWSNVSPDGRWLLLAQTERDQPVIWNAESSTRRVLAGNLADLSWFPDSGGLLGVTTKTADSPSRITTISTLSLTTATQTGESFDYRSYDPAGLGDSLDRRYAMPLFSPDGTMTSFFVIDEQQPSVTLWLAGWGLPPRAVITWPLPADARLGAPLVAQWVAPDTLLVAVHQDWHAGLPGEVALRRIIVGDAGETRVDTPLTMRARGNERGLTLQELAQSPDGSRLAYRLRHYTQPDPDKGRFDTVRVVRSTDVGDSLELARSGPGDGIAWSPDSDWLAAPLRGQLMVFAANGRATATVSPEGAQSARPLWLWFGDLWFSLDEGEGPRAVHLGGAQPETRSGGGSIGGH